MVYMLFDDPSDKQDMAFLNDYETASIRRIYPFHKCNSAKQMLDACKDCITRSTEGDTIICWYDFMAILCWWLCEFQGKKREFIVLNILLKDKNTIKNKLAKFLYKLALESSKVRATVTSRRYGEYLNKMLGIHKDYILLHDIYHDGYSIDYKGRIIPNTVFCGGRNGRDWEFLIKIAHTMPNVIFNCVMPQNRFEQYRENFNSNMMVRSDIPEKEFLEFMCRSQLVVMPLDTEAPAGLITFFQAAANGKMIITSNTVTTQEYFTDGRGALCEKSPEEWKKKIQYYLKHMDEANCCTVRLKNFLKGECSEEKYAKALWGILAK